MKEIGEETGPLNAKHDATLTKILKKMLCELEVSEHMAQIYPYQ